MVEEQPTGCGGTTYKALGASTNTKDVQRNLALSARIDDNFSSCRTPLQVYQDVLTDKECCEAMTETMIDRLKERAGDLKEIAPPCDCQGTAVDKGPYYVHLGHASSRSGLRGHFEKLTGLRGNALRIEAIKFSGKEGKTEEECPIAKWILRRTNDEEKVLVVAKQRFGHRCEYTWTIMLIVQWDGLPRQMADRAYMEIAEKTAAYGTETERQCGANRKKTCACQGLNMDFSGASYTFGCNWTKYHNICKFCRSFDVHKFKLKDDSAEEGLEDICLELTNTVGDIYRNLAPASHANMCLFEEVAGNCRIGDERKTGRPFSGITTVCDFCAHSHKDSNNMVGGATAIVTLLRPQDRDVKKPEELQYHVLPLYCPDMTDREVNEKVARGGLEVLDKFARTIAVRDEKMAGCKRGRLTAAKKDYLDKLAKDHANLPMSMPKDERTFTDPSLRPPGIPPTPAMPEISPANPELLPQLDGQADEVEEVSETYASLSRSDASCGKDCVEIVATNKSFSENWCFPKSMPQLDGEGVDGDEEGVVEVGATYSQLLQKSSGTCKKFSKSWCFPRSMPQLDGEGGEGGDEAGDGDATIHDLDEQADLSINQSLDAEELNMEADELAKSMEGVKIRVKQSDCLEAFRDPSIGGVALALPHGSVVIECAKAELHATTALSQPNREEPCRIGLVFYQHKNLHHPSHGAGEFQRKRAIREFRDYVQWLKGNYVPTEAKLRSMVESGFVFPETCKAILKPMEVATPMDYFQFHSDADNEEVGNMLKEIDTKDDLELMGGYLRWLNAAPEPDDEVDFRPLLQSDEYWIRMGESEEVKELERMLEEEEMA